MDRSERLADALAVAWGCAVTLAVVGYTFGTGNHHVYLLDAARLAEPGLFSRDWFVTGTLQYHAAFGWLTQALARLDALAAGFLILQLLTVVGLHAAWLGIVRRLGFDWRVYALGVLLYYASVGGLGLGVYRFHQDGQFLPSNVAAVAGLGAVYFWTARRTFAAALCAGVAGAFHLNYSLVVSLAWGVATPVEWRGGGRRVGRWMLASLVAVGPCAANVLYALLNRGRHAEAIPLGDFVELYVRLRHPHHYDPSSWPWPLWAGFLWPLPFTVYALATRPRTPATRAVAATFAVSLGLSVVALVGAGLWYVSETLVQMSLFRFSVYAKLIACTLVAALIVGRGPRAAAVVAFGVAIVAIAAMFVPHPAVVDHRGLLVGMAGLSAIAGLAMLVRRRWHRSAVAAMVVVAAPVVVVAAVGGRVGIRMPGEADPSLVELARWCRANTPRDALFVVPPDDSSWRLESRRAAVVSFKQVPQLSGELVGWRDRLADVLGEDPRILPRPMPRTLDAMAGRYAALPPEHLSSIAHKYEAEYVVAASRWPAGFDGRLVHASADGRFVLYRASP